MRKPKISVIILNHNREKFLDRSIRSCMNQEVFDKDLEILIVDDKSTDNSRKIINYFKKNYTIDLKTIILNKNYGPGYCSNLAVKKAKGDYFIRVDSDDYLGRLAIENMANILINNKEFAYVYCDLIKINEIGFRQKLIKLNKGDNKYNHGAGIMFRKKIITKVGNFNKDLREAEDFHLLKKIDKKYKSFYLPIPFYRYYIHDKNISHSGNRKKIIEKIKNNEF